MYIKSKFITLLLTIDCIFLTEIICYHNEDNYFKHKILNPNHILTEYKLIFLNIFLLSLQDVGSNAGRGGSLRTSLARHGHGLPLDHLASAPLLHS